MGEYRCVLETRTLGTGRPALAGVKDPGRRQTTHVLRRDLHGTRKSLSARVAAIARPFLGCGTGGESQRQQRGDRRPQFNPNPWCRFRTLTMRLLRRQAPRNNHDLPCHGEWNEAISVVQPAVFVASLWRTGLTSIQYLPRLTRRPAAERSPSPVEGPKSALPAHLSTSREGLALDESTAVDPTHKSAAPAIPPQTVIRPRCQHS